MFLCVGTHVYTHFPLVKLLMEFVYKFKEADFLRIEFREDVGLCDPTMAGVQDKLSRPLTQSPMSFQM